MNRSPQFLDFAVAVAQIRATLTPKQGAALADELATIDALAQREARRLAGFHRARVDDAQREAERKLVAARLTQYRAVHPGESRAGAIRWISAMTRLTRWAVRCHVEQIDRAASTRRTNDRQTGRMNRNKADR